MIFNSLIFPIFFVIVFGAYWSLQAISSRIRAQNALLLVASYIFYGAWDPVFLGLIILSTLQKYSFTLWMEKQTRPSYRKLLLVTVVGTNFLLLGLFKYFNFFASELMGFMHNLGVGDGSRSFIIENLILPVGISFYTFQATAYTVDVYRRRIQPERSLLLFALFDCYFPQLVAGPIERAEELLPRLRNARMFDMDLFSRSAWDILYGFFLKVVVADSLGPLVDSFYGTKAQYMAHPAWGQGVGAGQTFVTALAYTGQIYCDFAGYSSIAMGTSGLLGIPLTRNFLQPLLASNPGDFWRRWHTSLMRWFTDYVYRPLGGNRVSKFRHAMNLMIVFLVSGLWHGANWTFIAWGGLNGLYVMLHRFFGERFGGPAGERNMLSRATGVLGSIGTVLLVAFAFLFFRAYDISQVFSFLQGAMRGLDRNETGLAAFELPGYALTVLTILLPVLILDGCTRWFKSDYWILERPAPLRVLAYVYLFATIVLTGQFGKEVIYFAF